MARDIGVGSLGVVSFGVAFGLTAAIFVFVLGVTAAFFGWGVLLATALSSLFIGYSPTLVGSIAGAVWAFFLGFIAGILIAWFYNRMLVGRRSRLIS